MRARGYHFGLLSAEFWKDSSCVRWVCLESTDAFFSFSPRLLVSPIHLFGGGSWKGISGPWDDTLLCYPQAGFGAFNLGRALIG